MSQRPGMNDCAPGMERAAGRPVERVRNRAADGRQFHPRPGFDAGNGLQQGSRVRMPGIVKDVVDLALLHHAAEIHDDHVVGHLRDHAEVVGDQHDGHSPFLLNPAQQVQDLGLRRDVERRRRLVGDEEARIAGQRDRDHRALPEPAAQFEGVLVDAPFRLGDADAAQRFDATAARLLPADIVVEHDRLDELRPHGVHGTEGGHRLLEDEADFSPSDRANLPAVGLELDEVGFRPVLAREQDLSVDDSPGLIDDAQDRLRGDALAAAALADDAEGLSRLHVEGHAVDGLGRALVLEETRLEVAHR